MNGPEPLIITLEMDDTSFKHFDGMRRRYFPVERNLISAHVTLFHHLPGHQLRLIETKLAVVCLHQAPFLVHATGPRFLGRGVAIDLASTELLDVRTRLAEGWTELMTRQDLQPWRPHVTIQNKAEPADAKLLHAELGGSFLPFLIEARGVLLWRYLSGPWQLLRSFRFKANS